jgi:hypothetical protein
LASARPSDSREAYLLGRLGLGFAFAGRQQVDGAADLGGNALLRDRLGRRACLDGRQRLRGGDPGFHTGKRHTVAASGQRTT